MEVNNSELADMELEANINTMSKIEVMDKWVDTFSEKISSSEICRIVEELFDFDLRAKTPLSATNLDTATSVIDSYLEIHKNKVTGADIRKMINEVFGINLDAIASLEKARISLFSKDQWVVHHDKDLFVVHTGAGDVDAWVYPTEYFMKQTGKEELPAELQEMLVQLGYSYNDEKGKYYYANPTGQAVPDSFKGKTIGAIVKVIQNSNLHM